MLGEGDTLTEVTKDWLKALPDGKGLESRDSFTLLQDAEGNQYLYGNCYRDEESSSAHLWKEADGSVGYYTTEVAGTYGYGWLSVL